jgi:hypothetical protein
MRGPSPEALKEIVRIVQIAQPDKIILFGSAARGERRSLLATAEKRCSTLKAPPGFSATRQVRTCSRSRVPARQNSICDLSRVTASA